MKISGYIVSIASEALLSLKRTIQIFLESIFIIHLVYKNRTTDNVHHIPFLDCRPPFIISWDISSPYLKRAAWCSALCNCAVINSVLQGAATTPCSATWLQNNNNRLPAGEKKEYIHKIKYMSMITIHMTKIHTFYIRVCLQCQVIQYKSLYISVRVISDPAVLLVC